ncbi:TylF/MycF/NovP-related O-methyltransferase [Butyrivibrio sp. WCE2006]|uniref:TylF/MycF/NovP-related O-methyltransferase n=1 Tax=Butyrivibrio sp. WCE2006 TaxID=1410611 RepID=UPI0005D225CF|nr:TylF/MycF/NovP-related O-methyltransferase [Butyrivibrio sp. WCE2006]
MRVLIFGAGEFGRALNCFYQNDNSVEVVGFVDNAFTDKKKIDGVNVFPPKVVNEISFDLIIISNSKESVRNDIFKQLVALSVPNNKIKVLMEDLELKEKVFVLYNRYDENKDPRVIWVKRFAEYAEEEKIRGSIAECGVNRGEFAQYMNTFFKYKKLYLFDTFDGFDIRDLDHERQIRDNDFLHGKFNNTEGFKATSERIVINRMPHKELCILRKGYFPESSRGIEDEFCFVNLDMDLYKPMLAGLEFFYNKMVDGGIILLHDYFSKELSGVRKAVRDFEVQNNMRLRRFPIGDNCSIAIIK